MVPFFSEEAQSSGRLSCSHPRAPFALLRARPLLARSCVCVCTVESEGDRERETVHMAHSSSTLPPILAPLFSTSIPSSASDLFRTLLRQPGLDGRTFSSSLFVTKKRTKKSTPLEISRISLACRKSKYQPSHFCPCLCFFPPSFRAGNMLQGLQARCHAGSEGEGESMATNTLFSQIPLSALPSVS